MSNETEKLTVNLGVVELAQIDVLVGQGIYANRSDFIRTSIRKHLETYKEKIEQSLEPLSGKSHVSKAIGIFHISKKELEKIAANNDKINISVIGMLIIDASVSAELFERAVESVTLRGKLVASNEIRKMLEMD
jgi:Arc/MetJ-type ribon-helix-helix transcriptional regulator